MREAAAPSDRLAIVDALRGLAAALVCWFHFTQGVPGLPSAEWLRGSGACGHLGVEVFFVISGFILPYSLRRGGYAWRDYPTFVWKRLVRLEPPYLAALALTVGLWWASTQAPGFRGAPFQLEPGRVLSHLGYATGLCGQVWLNPAFWSLAIELQYYLLVGLAFPLLVHRSPGTPWLAALGCGLAAWATPNGLWAPHFFGLFGIGIAAFHYLEGRWSAPELLVATAGLAGATAWRMGPYAALAAALTGLAIAFVRFRPPGVLLWLGTLSYSLYLLHIPVGGRVVNLGARWSGGLLRDAVVLAAAWGASLAAAWLLHRFVELPAQRWASRWRYAAKCSAG